MVGYRDLIHELSEASQPLLVLRKLEQSLVSGGTTSDYLAADSLLKGADLSRLPLKPIRVYFLRSFTLEQLVPVLRVRALLAGLRAEIAMSPYGQYQQDVLDPNSDLYRFQPNVVVLAVLLGDLAPSLENDFAALTTEQVAEAKEQVLSTFRTLLTHMRARLKATILVHNFATPAVPSYGIFDHQNAGGQIQAIHDLNSSLRALCRSFPGVYVFDYDGLTSMYGKSAWTDSRMWHMARMAVSPHQLPHLAGEYVRYLVNIAGMTRKCLILDLDGTLWGGIVGDDGMGGIKLGTTYPGSAYVDFQRAVLDLYRRGIILAICSKNDPETALEVIDKHPNMVLRREHFASMRINWADKAANIREIVQELNIGIDGVVFLDDNPAEVELVRAALPEVLSYRMPAQPEEFVAFLRSLPVFDMLTVTDEDRRRGEEYRQQAARRALRTESATLEDFYRQLEMKARIAEASDLTLPRIAQLTQKTNQFNLTTRRYTEQELRERITASGWHVYSLQLEDRFGDNGLVAVGILRPEAELMWIDTLLMSCRVMGRTVEQTFVYHLAVEARRLGYKKLMAEYIPTRKNKVVADLFPSLGFNPVGTLTSESVAASGTSFPPSLSMAQPGLSEISAATEPGVDPELVSGPAISMGNSDHRQSAGRTADPGHTVWCLDLENLKLRPSPFVVVINGC